MGEALIDDIVQIMEKIAPVTLAEEWDNPGLLVGNGKEKVTGITVALDCNEDTVDFAVKNGCNLIVTHHPLIFHPMNSVTDKTADGKIALKLISSGVSLYSAHTNFDKVKGGTDDVFAEMLGIADAEVLSEDGFGRIGKTNVTVGELKKKIYANIGVNAITTADDGRTVSVIASCAGAGGDAAEAAIGKNADIFVTGEMSYHKALDLKRLGLDVMLCSHQGSEQISMESLKSSLQNHLKGVKYNIKVISAPFCPLWR